MSSGLLSLLGAACTIVVALAEPIQQPLNLVFPPESRYAGQLRRYEVGTNSSILDQVLRVAKAHDLDVWQVAPGSHVDIFSPVSAPLLPLSLQGIPHSLKDIPAPELSASSTTPSEDLLADWDLSSLANTTFHSSYHPLFEIEAFIHELAALHPDKIRVTNLGHSGEGREMSALSISRAHYDTAIEDEAKVEGGEKKEKLDKKRKRRKKKKHGDIARPAFVIIGAQHAREWVATATSLYLAHALVSDASERHSLSHLLDFFDFHIIPAPNPDGYSYTWETDRFWYKTRQKMDPHTKCLGLDMNRNWGYKWKADAPSMLKHASIRKSHDHTQNATTKAHHSQPTTYQYGDEPDHSAAVPREPTDPCSHWYPGHRPFEAPEVNNIANWVITLPHLVGFLDLRSYGQMLSSPYSYSCKRIPKDAEDQIEAGLGAVRALQQLHGTSFVMGQLCHMLYRAPGNILDWMYARVKVKYSYVVHLRDTGTYGFSLPSRLIRPVGEETGGMVGYLAKFIEKQMKKTM